MSVPEAAVCGNCAHFAARMGDEEVGQCRRFPPHPHRFEDLVEDPVTGREVISHRWGSVWPVVDARDWCSEHTEV
jgi:hypothetical protein